MFLRGVGCLCVVVLAISVSCTPSAATTWNITASWQFDGIAASVQPGDIISVAPGDYYPSRSLYFTTPNITLTGSTGNRDDVRIHGAGMNVDAGDSRNNLIQLVASGITVQNLTIQDVNQNGINIHGEIAGGITGSSILNVHTLNIGERHIKGAGGVSQGQYNDYNVLIQGCLLEQTVARSGYAASSMGYDYIGGIDAMGTNNWIVRNNVMKNIQGPNGDGRGAIFIWNGTNDTVENNVIIGCDRGIAFGNPSSTFGPDHSIIRNNVIVRGAGIGLELDFTSNIQVYNNTIYSPDATYWRTVQAYGAQTNLQGTNNLIRGAVSLMSGGAWTSTNNIIDTAGVTVTPSWFVNTATGDLHLTAAATAAINHGIVLSQVTGDMDGQARSSSPDIGADERTLHPGDANKDGKVDVVDLGVLALNYDAAFGATWANGDFNGGGAVDVIDLGIMARNYDWVGAGTSVPEPASLTLLAAGLFGLIRRR